MTTSSYVSAVSENSDYFKFKENTPLTYMDIELTERCNLNCRHCYINLPENDLAAQKRELTFDELTTIISDAANLGCVTIRFTGGEPLLRPDFPELYLFTRKLGIRVVLFTNLTLVTPELISLFKEIPPLEPIEVTVYGMSEETTFSVTRVKDVYVKTGKGIGLLTHAGIPFTVKTVRLPQNKSDMDIFQDWQRTLPQAEEEAMIIDTLDLRCRRDLPFKNDAIISMRAAPKDIYAFMEEMNINTREAQTSFFKKFYTPPGRKLFTCQNEPSVSMDAYGNFQVCLMLRHPETTAHSSEISLKKAIREFFPSLMKREALSKDYLKHCGVCFLHSFCQQCPAKSYMEHGTLDTPVQYYCDLTHYLAEASGLLLPGEKGWNVDHASARIQQFTKEKCFSA